MNKLAAVSSLVLFLAACGVNDDGTPGANTPPTVTLAASPGGAAPLTVSLNATAADPDGDALSYAWSLPGLPDAATVQTTFAAPGEYPVSVTVSDGQDSASASVTVSVTGGEGAAPVTPGEPAAPVTPPTSPTPPTEPEPAKPTIKLTASPGGAAPWAVRYDISATGYPQGSTFSPDCLSENGGSYAEPIDDDTFACFHGAAGERVEVAVYAPNNTVPIDTKTFPARVESEADVPFGGTWRYTNTATGETGTFTVTQGERNGSVGASGTDATGTYRISYYDQDLDLDINFNWPTGNGGEEMRPRPLSDGTQRYEYVDFTRPEPEVPIVLEQID